MVLPIERKQDLFLQPRAADLRPDSVQRHGRFWYDDSVSKTVAIKHVYLQYKKQFIDRCFPVFYRNKKTYLYFSLDKINFLLIFSGRDKFPF